MVFFLHLSDTLCDNWATEHSSLKCFLWGIDCFAPGQHVTFDVLVYPYTAIYWQFSVCRILLPSATHGKKDDLTIDMSTNKVATAMGTQQSEGCSHYGSLSGLVDGTISLNWRGYKGTPDDDTYHCSDHPHDITAPISHSLWVTTCRCKKSSSTSW
jgi:hypothetical protein